MIFGDAGDGDADVNVDYKQTNTNHNAALSHVIYKPVHSIELRVSLIPIESQAWLH
jgi:hypothetical protein